MATLEAGKLDPERLELAVEAYCRSCEKFGSRIRDDMSAAILAYLSGPEQADDWRDDPSADERWNAGLDYGMEQLCALLGVDPQSVTWEAATETVDGDVQSVLGNILRVKYGEDWSPRAVLSRPLSGPERAAEQMLEALKRCALEIEQIRNRKRTADEQIALDNARDVIAKAEARPSAIAAAQEQKP